MNNWAGRSVFVTGATGLLGSWLVKELLEQEATVTCLIRDEVPDSELVRSGARERVNVVQGELEDFTFILRVINEFEVDSVFHLGAQTIVGTAVRSPLSTFESNIRGTWNLLEACRQCSGLVERIVVASSDKAYGNHEVLPYTEDAPLQGRFPYDVSKSCTDLIALSYFHTYDIPVAITRCGNLFGGGDLNFNRIVPGTIRSLLADQSPVIRSDGSLVRDYFYVRDAVQAYMDLADRLPATGYGGEAFNFGNEKPLSVLEIVDAVTTAVGKSMEPTILGESSQEIPRQYLDCTKARTRLEWSPRWTLEDGLAETVDWYRGCSSTD